MWFGDPTQFTGPSINNKYKQIILYIATFNINFYMKQNTMLVKQQQSQQDTWKICWFSVTKTKCCKQYTDSNRAMKKITSQWQNQEQSDGQNT